MEFINIRINPRRIFYMKNIGKKFNRLTILQIDEDKKQEQIQKGKKPRKYYICQCDCGTILSIRADNVVSGHSQSCGCHRADNNKEIAKNLIRDLTGQKFGKLTALRLDNYTPGTGVKWVCQCECGTICSVYATNLTKLHTTSCGCASQSIGEENIEKILKENNINYSKQYTFNDLKNKRRLRFDFAIFNENNNLSHLIEFDGRQHTNDYNVWGGTETLEERCLRDELKNLYCKNHNIKLIRIPYTKRDNIKLQDLL